MELTDDHGLLNSELLLRLSRFHAEYREHRAWCKENEELQAADPAPDLSRNPKMTEQPDGGLLVEWPTVTAAEVYLNRTVALARSCTSLQRSTRTIGEALVSAIRILLERTVSLVVP